MVVCDIYKKYIDEDYYLVNRFIEIGFVNMFFGILVVSVISYFYAFFSL